MADTTLVCHVVFACYLFMSIKMSHAATRVKESNCTQQMHTILGLLHQLANSAWREPMPEKVIEIKTSKATPRRVDIQADRADQVLTVYRSNEAAQRTQSGNNIQSIMLQQARVDHV